MKKEAVRKAKEVSIQTKAKPSMALAIAALILNAMVLPGLGTLLGGRIKIGVVQVVVCVSGFVLGIFGFVIALLAPILGLFLAMLGGIMVVSVWVWAMVSGVMLVREANM